MDIIQDIFQAFKSTAELARATGDPIQTVDSWYANNNIPRWRRAPVLDAARRLDVVLPPHAAAYLASDDRLPRVARVRRPTPTDKAAAA